MKAKDKPNKKTTNQALSFWDILIGLTAALFISDHLVEPQFAAAGLSYSQKIFNWLIVTVIFLLIGLGLILACWVIRLAFKTFLKR